MNRSSFKKIYELRLSFWIGFTETPWSVLRLCFWESLKLENPGSVLSSRTKNVTSFLPTVNGFRGSGRLRISKGFSGLILRAETMLTDGFVNKFTFRHFRFVLETPPFNPTIALSRLFWPHHRIRDSIAGTGMQWNCIRNYKKFCQERNIFVAL